MTSNEFRASAEMPATGPALQALWWAGRAEWDRAHTLVQGAEGVPECDWVHAYLHRVEGDLGNARYWYRRAGRPEAHGALEAEWAEIAADLLAAEETRQKENSLG